MNDLKVYRWISWEEAERYLNSLDKIGGFVKPGIGWSAYLKRIALPGEREYLDALRREIVHKDIRISGEAHQHSEHGVPQFSDGTVATFSMRGWGDLMAAIWNTQGEEHGYFDFYMDR